MFKKSQRKQIQFRAFLWQPNVLEPEARSRLLDEAKLQSTLHLAPTGNGRSWQLINKIP